MFEKGFEIEQDEFYKKYGGQRYRGILTPARYPFIYLIYTEGEYELDNIDVNGDGTNSEVHFTYEGSGLKRAGNRAVCDHRSRKGVYHSIFLFQTVKDKSVFRYIGEYEIDEKFKFEDNYAFKLQKIESNVDEIPIYLVEDIIKYDKRNIAIISELGRRSGYFELNEESRILAKEVLDDVEVGSYLLIKDENADEYEVVTTLKEKLLKDTTEDIRKKKVQQHIWILQIQNSFIKRAAKSVANKFDITSTVTSYHVNTGCGNASFLVLKKNNKSQLWCYDCGIEGSFTKDLDSNKLPTSTYKENISKCLLHIQNTHFGGNEVTFSKIFITHPHADHYNSLLFDIDKKYFDSNSEVWINPYILTAGKDYIKFLMKIEKAKCKVVELVASNSISGINILYPEKSIIYGHKMPGKIKFKLPKVHMKKTSGTFNDLSPIIRFDICGRSMLMTGDIEKDGWSEYANRCARSGCSSETVDVYCHSHHGSPTGCNINCLVTPGPHNVSKCIKWNYHELLMTRNGAFSGIVEKSLDKKLNVLRTDSQNKTSTPVVFIEIDWLTMKEKII